jgi:hypothetical protein
VRRQGRDRWLWPDHKLQRWNEVDDKLAVRAQRLAQGAPPPAKLRLALAQKQVNKALEGFGQGGVRDIPLVLVELARRQKTARRHESLVQLVHHRGLADTGIARHQHQFRDAVNHDPVEGREQYLDLALPAVELLRDEQPVRYIVSTELERVDAAVRIPFPLAAPQIAGNAGGGLIPLLGGLRQQLHHDRRERRGDFLRILVGRGRLPGDVAVHPLHRIGRF